MDKSEAPERSSERTKGSETQRVESQPEIQNNQTRPIEKKPRNNYKKRCQELEKRIAELEGKNTVTVETPAPKPKRKCTEKQLAALAAGRAKNPRLMAKQAKESEKKESEKKD